MVKWDVKKIIKETHEKQQVLLGLDQKFLNWGLRTISRGSVNTLSDSVPKALEFVVFSDIAPRLDVHEKYTIIHPNRTMTSFFALHFRIDTQEKFKIS